MSGNFKTTITESISVKIPKGKISRQEHTLSIDESIMPNHLEYAITYPDFRTFTGMKPIYTKELNIEEVKKINRKQSYDSLIRYIDNVINSLGEAKKELEARSSNWL
jgi:hypothetical protein